MKSLCTLALTLIPIVATAEPAARHVVVISDLHLGVGRLPNSPANPKANLQTWDPFEDFRWAEEFELFLDYLNREGRGAVDLVMNGDTFELWQSHDGKCPMLADKNLGCTAEEATARISQIIKEHSRELAAIEKFATASENRVWIVPGNHDAALLFPAVATAVKSVLPSEHVAIVTEGRWVSANKLFIAEHGHTIGKDPNNFDKWPKPFLQASKQQHLQRPWGEQFVIGYYNDWEMRYPIVDNITEEFAGAKIIMSVEGVPSTLKQSAIFFKFSLFDVSWPQFATGYLGPEGTEPPVWNLKALRSQSPTALVKLLPQGDPLGSSLQNLAGAKMLQELFTDDELRLLCDRAFAIRLDEVNHKLRSDTGMPCPGPQVMGDAAENTLGSISESLFRERDKVIAEHLKRLRSSLPDNPEFKAYVFSHTHRAVLPFQPIRTGKFLPWVVNSGAWQRTVTPRQLESQKKNKSAAEIMKMQPEQLPPCYSFVWLKPNQVKPELYSWQRTGTTWSASGSQCSELAF